MSRKLDIKSYRKLIDISLELSPNLNLVSGTNGTCKSSILYLLSNSYKQRNASNTSGNLKNCINTINSINSIMNPKIETLSRGDKQFNDPTNGKKGSILEVTYFDNSKLEFRKHNSPKNSRYSIKPNYARGKNESLPEMPVIYLGLSRLLSYGEYQELHLEKISEKLSKSLELDNQTLTKIKNILKRELKDSYISQIKSSLPLEYINTINQIYSSFTNIDVTHESYSNIGMKKRAEFKTSIDGIDSNTISAGEDNLYIIITALVSLKYYYDELQKEVGVDENHHISSLLLIDEIDATLHPSYQLKLYNLLKTYSEDYSIQIVFTTHSFSLIEHGINKKANVLYLLNEQNKVSVCEEIDMFTIRMYLEQVTSSELRESNKIPIFTEDAEARKLLNDIFMVLGDWDPQILKVREVFHFVDSNVGSSNLQSIFRDEILTNNIIKAICVLDGDAKNQLESNIITLPGKTNPEQLIFDYLNILIESEDYAEFWSNKKPHVRDGYSYDKAKEIRAEIEAISVYLEKLPSKKGKRREKNKELYRKYDSFFSVVFIEWLKDKRNQTEVQFFYNNLFSMFKKTRVAYSIPASVWKNKKKLFESVEYANN
ncbi:AAA family ATPase [Paenibacillus sp. DCT19]|uniref:AAA family ATPase n=1 Tax=Paenibacillus sp. DCT19 TaxID=2211212 RepID=UPI000FE214E5|nr:AAA family ATPase [Paenibacillus sp. DCT19]